MRNLCRITQIFWQTEQAGIRLTMPALGRAMQPTYQDATAYLTGRYATDTAYSTKLNRIIAQYGLDQYDNYQPVVEEEVEEPDAGNIDFETPT